MRRKFVKYPHVNTLVEDYLNLGSFKAVGEKYHVSPQRIHEILNKSEKDGLIEKFPRYQGRFQRNITKEIIIETVKEDKGLWKASKTLKISFDRLKSFFTHEELLALKKNLREERAHKEDVEKG